MVLPLFLDDSKNGGHRSRIASSKSLHLLLEVSQDHALDRHGGCGYRPCTEEARNQPKDQASQAAKPVAATTSSATPLQLCTEDLAVPFLMRPEFSELIYQVRRRKAGHDDLARVYVHGSMLAGMIDLNDAASEVACGWSLRHASLMRSAHGPLIDAGSVRRIARVIFVASLQLFGLLHDLVRRISEIAETE